MSDTLMLCIHCLLESLTKGAVYGDTFECEKHGSTKFYIAGISSQHNNNTKAIRIKLDMIIPNSEDKDISGPCDRKHKDDNLAQKSKDALDILKKGTQNVTSGQATAQETDLQGSDTVQRNDTDLLRLLQKQFGVRPANGSSHALPEKKV